MEGTVQGENKLVGALQEEAKLSGKLYSNGSMLGSIGTVFVKDVRTEEYEGSYVVTPKVEAQTLETKQKLMADDVTIKEIPFYDTSNNAGGTTVYIGSSIV